MTETGHGSNVAVAAHDRDLRPGHAGVRDRHARRRRAQGLHRQRRACTAALAAVFAQLERRRRARTACTALLVPIRDEDGTAAARASASRTAARRSGLNGVDNGRLWFDGVRVPRDAPARPLRPGRRRRRVPSAIENPGARFFTMLGTLVQGRVSVGRRVWRAAKVALPSPSRYATARRQFGPPTAREVAAARLPRRTSAGCCRALGDDLRAALRAGASSSTSCTHVQTADSGRATSASVLETNAAGLKALATWHAHRDDPDLPRGLRRRRLPARRTASPRSRPTPTSSRRSRATTPCCCSSSARAC